MKGRHHIVVESTNIKYEFDVRRNITVIQGDSATGKTTLIGILAEYANRGKDRGIRLESDVPCFVYTAAEDRWEHELADISGNIVFIDEDYRFIYSKEFAGYIKDSDNYYVLIARKPLYYLPYSIQEIYGIRTSGKYHFPEQAYHEFYPIYTESSVNKEESRVLLLVEDKEAGYDFYRNVAGDQRCTSAEGNANVYLKVLELDNPDGLLVIADGAAFGAYIDRLVKYTEIRSHIALYFPESFEWMVLKSGIIKDTEIEQILKNPEDYIDSGEYFSWERFFTNLLIEKTEKDQYRRYSKTGESEYYKGQNAERILRVMPEEIRKLI